MRFDRREALLPCTRLAPRFVDGEQGELARIVDRSGELDQFCGRGGVGSAQVVDLFAIMQRLRGQDLPLRLGLMSAVFGHDQLVFAVRKALLQEVALRLEVAVCMRCATGQSQVG